MGERPLLARLATDVLARERDIETTPSEARERQAIEAMEKAIVRAHERRRVRTWIVGAVGVAAAAAAVFVAFHSKSAPIVVAPPVPPAVEIALEGNATKSGEHVITNDGRAVYAFATGTRVRVEPHGDVDLGIVPDKQELSLRAGSLHADVAKLGLGQRFLVTTIDAEVEVRGTSFTVAVADHATCGTLTSVSVTEGTVWVRFHGSETVLPAGSNWPPQCTAQTDPPPAPVSVAIATQQTTQQAPIAIARPTAAATTPAPVASTETSYLAEQTRIFEEAREAKRRGDIAGALAGFDRVTDGRLAESAAAEKMRALSGSHDPRARSAAETYLARYPNGFAAAEARAILRP